MPGVCCDYIPAIPNCVTDVALPPLEWPPRYGLRLVALRTKAFRLKALS